MKTMASIHGDGMIGSLVQMAIMVLLVVAGAYLYVPWQTGRQLKNKLAAARAELAELEILHPLYLELVRLDAPSQWPGLVLPLPKKLAEGDIASVPDHFMQLATNCLVELNSASPRVNIDEDGNRHLNVELRATGPYAQLKAFLMGLVHLPAMERIEKLEIRREALQEQFTVAVRLALE